MNFRFGQDASVRKQPRRMWSVAVVPVLLGACSQPNEQQTVGDQESLFANQELLDAQREIPS